MGACFIKQNNKDNKDNKLEQTIIQKNVMHDDCCSICLQPILIAKRYESKHKTIINFPEPDFTTMPCGNIFHKSCLSQFYNNNNNNNETKCPICRTLFIISKNDEIIEYKTTYDKPISKSLENKLDAFIQKKIANKEL